MNIKLDVPIINQPEGTQHCALASVRMLMAFSGEEISHEKLVELFPEVNTTRVGITPATANFLVNHGYDVFYSTNQKSLVTEDLGNKTEKDLELIKQKVEESFEQNSEERLQWDQIIKFMESGGKFSTSENNLSDLDRNLEIGVPVRVGIKSSVFYSDPKYKLNHAVIVSGAENGKYRISDSAPRFEESYLIDRETLEKARKVNGSIIMTAVK